MKKILFGAALLTLVACGGSSNVGNTASGAAKVLNIASAISEIIGLLGGGSNSLNLNSNQTNTITSALNKYISAYNTVSTITDVAARANQLNTAKTTALNTIKGAVSTEQYTSIVGTLTNAIGNKSTSATTATLLSSLLK